MAQSDLERIAIEERKEYAISKGNHGHPMGYEAYTNEDERDYSKNDKFHIYEGEGDLRGKGSEKENPPYDALNLKDLVKLSHDTATEYGKTINTNNGGGEYDIYGTKDVEGAFQGDGGRKYLTETSALNKYNKTQAYGTESVSIDEKSIKGQYIVQ